MRNKTEELNGHSALSKSFNPALSATSHPPFPLKLNSDMVHVRREDGKEMEQWSKGQAQDKHVQGEEETE